MKKIILVVLIAAILLSLTACVGNNSVWDGLSNESNSFNYILVEEAGVYHLHEIEKWADSSESDAVGVITKCCDNRFWTSYNRAIIYRGYPADLSDDVIICRK